MRRAELLIWATVSPRAGSEGAAWECLLRHCFSSGDLAIVLPCRTLRLIPTGVKLTRLLRYLAYAIGKRCPEARLGSQIVPSISWACRSLHMVQRFFRNAADPDPIWSVPSRAILKACPSIFLTWPLPVAEAKNVGNAAWTGRCSTLLMCRS